MANLHLILLLASLVGRSFCDLDFYAREEDDVDPDGDKLPSFRWDKEHHEKTNGAEEKLWITFPDGGPDDAAILEHSNPLGDATKDSRDSEENDDDDGEVNNCIFFGHLANEPDVSVSLNGCPLNMTFDVSFSGDRIY